MAKGNIEFGLWFANMRERCGYDSQRKLAIASGVANSTIARIESGTQLPEPETLAKLAPYLKIGHRELMAIAGHLESNQEILTVDENEIYLTEEEKRFIRENRLLLGIVKGAANKYGENKVKEVLNLLLDLEQKENP